MDTKSHIMRFRRNQRSRNENNPLGVMALIAGGIISLLAAGIAISFVNRYTEITSGLPEPERMEVLFDPQSGSLLEPTRIMASGGEIELWRFENPVIDSRKYTSITDGSMFFFRDMSEDFLNATLAAHDPSYLTKPEGFLLCLLDGSPDPILQSLVDELLLWQELDHPDHPSRSRLLACQIAASYGRQKVLEWYLNSAYYGHDIYGAAQAAKYYFGMNLVDLDLAEAALLAAVSKYPALTPFDSPSAAKENQGDLLAEMQELELITERDGVRAADQQLFFASRDKGSNQTRPPYVTAILEEISLIIPEERLLRGGYQIISSIDSQLQSVLECTSAETLEQVFGDGENQAENCDAARLLPGYQGPILTDVNDLDLNLIIYDPDDGVIRAMASTGTTDNSNDLSLPRNPGSLITPFLYLNEFALGFEPGSLVWDIPLDDSSAEVMHPYCQDDCDFLGPVSIRTALVNDFLSPAQQLIASQSGNQLPNTLTVFGFSLDNGVCESCTILTDVPHLGLVDIVQGYGVFSNHGYLNGRSVSVAGFEVKPKLIEQVEDWSGEMIDAVHPLTQNKVISDELAYLINNSLSDVAARLNPVYRDAFQIGRPAAVKNGYVPGEAAAWVVGYTPELVIGVWAGSPDGTDPNAADYPQITANLWRGITQYISRDIPAEDWQQPPNILALDVCYPSGMLPTEYCPRVVRELFIRGNEPQGFDNLYQAREINRETGLLASVFTPVGQIEEQVFLNIPKLAESWAESSGQSAPPSLYDLDVPEIPVNGLELISPENFSFVRGAINVSGYIPDEGFLSARLQYGAGMNPISWLQIGEEIKLSGIRNRLGNWDTRDLDDGIYALQLVVILDGQQIEKTSIIVSIDNTPPVISLLGVPEGNVIPFQSGGEHLFEVKFENESEIEQVEFFLDNKRVYARDFPPFIFPWDLEEGDHELRITAEDQAGNLSEYEVLFEVSE